MPFREGPLGDLKVPLTWTAAVALIVAAVIAVAFLLADRRETLQEQAYGVTRQTVDTVAKPVSGAIAAPGRWTGLGLDFVRSYFFTASENRRLKTELAEMRQWRDRALDRGIVDGVRFVAGNAEALPLPDASQDACTNAFGLRNVTHMDQALAEVVRALRFGGRFVALEFGGPVQAGLDRIYDAYSQNVLPRMGQLVSGKGSAYQYLVDSIRNFPDRAEVAARMEAAGLSQVRTRALAGGIATLYSGWRL